MFYVLLDAVLSSAHMFLLSDTIHMSVHCMGHFTFWISLSLNPKIGLRPTISQKVKDSVNCSAIHRDQTLD